MTRPLARVLAPTRVTPNHLTTVRLLSGVAAAACFATDTTPWNIAGALLFLLSILMDRADGELARLQDSGSRFGAVYDVATDAVCNTAILIGLGMAALDGMLGDWALVLGVVAGISVGIIFTMVLVMEVRCGSGAGAFEGYAGFDPDDAMIAIPVGVLLGLGDVLVAIAGVLAPLAAILIFIEFRRRLGSIRSRT